MALTHDQQQALSDFKLFLESDSRVFILRGGAGTGKTTLLKEFIRLLSEKKSPFNLVAPTGRAALVATERTGCCASTIHRLIYEIKERPKKVDDRYIFDLKINHDTTNTVYFVDEASMVSDKFSDNELFVFGSGRLLNDLFSYCNIPTLNRKIVFIGDHAQLPPVGQNISPALNEEYLKTEYGLTTLSANINEVVRQAASSFINKNAQQIRGAIEGRLYTNFSIVDGNDVCKVDIPDFIGKYTDVAKRSSVDNCVVVTSSNRKALEYNSIIRERRYGQLNLPIRSNDLLLITRNNYSKQVDLYNGTIVKIVSASDFVDTQVAFVGKEQCKLHVRRVIISVDGQHISTLILDDFLNSPDGTLPPITQKALWAHFEQRMQREGVRSQSEFNLRIQDDEYINALQCKYGYAITCHKAQGGEWQNVFVDMDKSGGKANEGYFRWAYTAITRAKDMLFHISSPNFKESDFVEFGALEQCANKSISYYHPQEIDFLSCYFNILRSQCKEAGINCEDDRLAQNQHRIIFTRINDGASCKLSLWYSKKGYNRRIDCITSSNEDFKLEVIRLIQTLCSTTEIPYVPKFDKQLVMNGVLRSCAENNGFFLTNIEQQEWSEVYYFVGDNSICIIELYFNSKDRYTKIQPKSSAIENQQVNRFIESIKSEVYGTEC